MDTFKSWLNESNTRYSVEVNFRTKIKEVLESYARICLGYVSAALKQADLHVKQVFDDGLIRILVSARNWDDGSWTIVVSWNPHHNCFVITKGFYNKLNKQISYKIGSETHCKTDNASEITALVKSTMHQLKNEPDRHIQKLKGVPLKRGPKS